MPDPYFGYTTGSNTQLNESRRMAARMGEDIRYYPPPQGGDYPDGTIDWDNNNPYADVDDDDPERVAASASDSPEKIYKRVMTQDSTAVRLIAHQWWNVWSTLDELSTRVLKDATDLKEGGGGSDKGWTGAGADAFLARGPGATLKSIDDWKHAAAVNARGADRLADQIDIYQGKMRDFWESYKGHMVQAQDAYLEHTPFDRIEDIDDPSKGGSESWANGFINYMKRMSFEKAEEARRIQADMAAEYRRVMWEDFAGGRETVYEGPSDAIEPNKDFINRYLANKYAPNINVPNIAQPTVNPPNITAPNINTQDISSLTDPNATNPNITAPNINTPDLPNQQVAPNTTTPNITAPTVPVIPTPALPPGIAPGGPPAIRTSGLPTTAPGGGAGRLLNNLPNSTGPGVLRGAGQAQQGLPPGLPQGGPGQGTPKPQIKGRGPTPGQPSLPPQGKGGGSGKSTPATPATPGTPGQTNQFGGPPSTPSSPVLRNPRSTPTQGGRGPRKGTPGVTGPGATSAPSVPTPPGTSSPVLGRPRQSGPPTTPTVRPPVRSGPRVPGVDNPLAPPPAPTSSPVVGRSRTSPDALRPEPTSGVMRGNRRTESGYQGEITSRRREQAPDTSEANRIDEEFEKLSALLDREAPWTVATPGGGVLDGAPVRTATPSAEPKPTLGS